MTVVGELVCVNVIIIMIVVNELLHISVIMIMIVISELTYVSVIILWQWTNTYQCCNNYDSD